jgi:hypothetical protein
MKHKPNFEKWNADEMRAARRYIINKLLHTGFTSQKFIVYWTRQQEVDHYGIELRRYYYYEYHK